LGLARDFALVPMQYRLHRCLVAGIGKQGMMDLHAIKALAFDYYGTIADKHGLGTVIDQCIPGTNGSALAKLWFQTCQRFCFQNGMMGRYTPWDELSASALDFAAAELGVTVPDDVRSRLLEADAEAPVYPEASAALARLSDRLKLYVLSMGAPWMIERSQRQAGIDGYFSAIITTASDRVYKPHRTAYDVGVREIGLDGSEIGFVSGNSFDVIGAANYGLPTIWVRRYSQPLDGLGIEPDFIVEDLSGLADLLGA
jgi:2-haloacid dehalogenase